METYSEIVRHLKRPRKIKENAWQEFTHRKIKAPNPLYKGIPGQSIPPFVCKWLIEYNGKPVSLKDDLAGVNKFYGKGTSRS